MVVSIHKVWGPPGTGKTTRLMEYVEREVGNGVPLPRIAYLSFSRAAAEVIKERMNATEADVVWFRTIHGACAKVLGFGGAIISRTDYAAFSNQTGMKITPDDEWENTSDYNPTLRAINLAATTLKPVEEIVRTLPTNANLTVQRVVSFAQAWKTYKESVRRFDFMDMLTHYDKDGKPLPVDTVFLDEAQDLSPLQWRVFWKMAANAKRIYVAGDDDQSIYGFIGADEYGFLDCPCTNEEVLHYSHRVPRLIGERANKIIKKVKRRKEKEVNWKNIEGDVLTVNLTPFTMPWRDWQLKYKTIMILARHRYIARSVSEDLYAIGVPHSFHGESISSWKEAKIAYDYWVLREGGVVTPAAAARLCRAAGVDHAHLDALPRRGKVSKELVTLDYVTNLWTAQFGSGRKFEKIKKIIDKQGHGALVKDDQISILTMHGSKGKEAELVIIVPDCTDIVDINSPSEIRLAYVALTRTQKQTILMVPETDRYITHFFGS